MKQFNTTVKYPNKKDNGWVIKKDETFYSVKNPYNVYTTDKIIALRFARKSDAEDVIMSWYLKALIINASAYKAVEYDSV